MDTLVLDDLKEFFAESRHFQSTTLINQSTLVAEVKNIVARLDLLNGSVARHEREIAGVRQAAALASAETLASAKLDAAKAETSERWRQWVMPIVMMILGALGTLILREGPSILGRH